MQVAFFFMLLVYKQLQKIWNKRARIYWKVMDTRWHSWPSHDSMWLSNEQRFGQSFHCHYPDQICSSHSTSRSRCVLLCPWNKEQFCDRVRQQVSCCQHIRFSAIFACASYQKHQCQYHLQIRLSCCEPHPTECTFQFHRIPSLGTSITGSILST